MLKAVGYSRYSSLSQGDGTTIQTQKDKIEEYCLKNNYILIKHYSDSALSGRDAVHRKEFLEMISVIKLGEIDAVIVYTRDRFSRSVRDFIYYLQILDENNCKFICCNETHDIDTATGQLSSWIMIALSQYYVENLKREVLRGLRYNAYNGVWNGSIPPLGYYKDKNTKKLA